MKESDKLKEIELKKHDLEGDIAFLKSAYKYDLQRLEQQLRGIDNELLVWGTLNQIRNRPRNGADELVTARS